MKKLLLLLPLLFVAPVSAQEVYSININRFCAKIVGIPYASDNFSDEEFEKFKKCLRFVQSFQEY
jgi:hypothetical protein